MTQWKGDHCWLCKGLMRGMAADCRCTGRFWWFWSAYRRLRFGW